MLVTEIFKQFCNERYKEANLKKYKGYDYNSMQQIYASTEFFDVSLYSWKKENTRYYDLENNGYTYLCYTKDLEDFSLPFQNNFIKYKDDTYIFLREFSPNIITGTVYYTSFKFEGFCLNCPFSIELGETHDNESVIELKNMQDIYFLLKQRVQKELLQETLEEFAKNFFHIMLETCIIFKTLNKKAVVTDNYNTKSTGKQYADYYRLKGKPTIKVPSRPIYYVIGNKEEKDNENKVKRIKSRGYTEFTYAFHVRGHWRRIAEKSYGKDRNGNYNTLGYTWVNEYIKGEGELTKRLRVIKN